MLHCVLCPQSMSQSVIVTHKWMSNRVLCQVFADGYIHNISRNSRLPKKDPFSPRNKLRNNNRDNCFPNQAHSDSFYSNWKSRSQTRGGFSDISPTHHSPAGSIESEQKRKKGKKIKHFDSVLSKSSRAFCMTFAPKLTQRGGALSVFAIQVLIAVTGADGKRAFKTQEKKKFANSTGFAVI